jgi:hypothetical protein
MPRIFQELFSRFDRKNSRESNYRKPLYGHETLKKNFSYFPGGSKMVEKIKIDSPFSRSENSDNKSF